MAGRSEKGAVRVGGDEWNNLDVSASTGLFELSPTSIKSGQDSDVSSLYFPESCPADKHSTSRTSSSTESSLQDAERSQSLSAQISDFEEVCQPKTKKKPNRRRSLGKTSASMSAPGSCANVSASTRSAEQLSTSRTSSSTESSHLEPLQDAERSQSLAAQISDFENGCQPTTKKKTNRRRSLGKQLDSTSPPGPSANISARTRSADESGTSADETVGQTVPKRGGRGGGRRTMKFASQPSLQVVQEEEALDASQQTLRQQLAPGPPAARARGRRRKSAPEIATQVDVPLPTVGPSELPKLVSPEKPKVRRVRTVAAPATAREKTVESFTVVNSDCPDKRRTFVISIDVNVKTVPESKKDATETQGLAPTVVIRPSDLDTSAPVINILEERINELPSVTAIKEEEATQETLVAPQNSVCDQTFVKQKQEANTSSSDATMSTVRSRKDKKDKKGKHVRHHDSSNRRRSRRCSPSSSESSSEGSSCSCSDCMSSCSCSECHCSTSCSCSSGTEYTLSSCSCSDCRSTSSDSDPPPRRRTRK